MGRARVRWTVGLILAFGFGALAQPGVANAAVVGVALTTGSALNVRSGPSMAYPVVRTVPNGTALSVACQVSGHATVGTVRTTSLWDQLTDGRYVSDAYVAWRGARPALPWCSLRATVRATGSLNLRVNSSTLVRPIVWLSSGSPLAVVCQLRGDSVIGTVRTTDIWDKLTNGRFVSDAYVAWPGSRPAVPWCIFSAGPPPAVGSPFINWAAVHARQTKATYRVPASMTIAQAILESNWGRSGLTRDGTSFFGMKCFATPGPIAAGCRSYPTSECEGTRCFRTSANFRVYSSVAASFGDHGRSLAALPRYRTAFRYVNNPDRFAVEIHRAGYATSPMYAQNLISVMRKYNLYRFDR